MDQKDSVASDATQSRRGVVDVDQVPGIMAGLDKKEGYASDETQSLPDVLTLNCPMAHGPIHALLSDGKFMSLEACMRLSPLRAGSVPGAGMPCKWTPSPTTSATLVIIEPCCCVCFHSCVSGHLIITRRMAAAAALSAFLHDEG